MSTIVKRLKEINLRQIFVISTILSVLVSLVLISMGFVEIAMDQYYTAAKGNTIATHLFISLFIFCACNILILLHVVYITQYVLKGFRYHWHLSCHYFTYIIWEIISVCCVFSKHNYLQYPMALHILTAILFVLLFFFNYWAVQLFERLEEKFREAEEIRKLTSKGHYRHRAHCFTISLLPEDINNEAGTSKSNDNSVTSLDPKNES
jgi:hypothetical protein